MPYPLISEYVEAIKAAEDNFDELKYLRPVLDDAGEPVMSSGNFAVVFKMEDEKTGKLHAVKCFLKEQEGRAEAYRMIAEELEYVNSTFLTPIKYLDKELFVDTNTSDETEYPVLLMDWVEGMTLDKYIREHIDDEYELSLLAYQFSRLAMWLMPQPFAHGDLKPDNILVKKDGTLVLVDYDGMYVPAMKGQKARELGSPDFRHPGRTEEVFDEHIDDFTLASILLSLKAIALQPDLLEEYGASDRLLFSEKDYKDIYRCRLLKELYPSEDSELNVLLGLFTIALAKGNLANVSSNLFDLPQTSDLIDEIVEAWFKEAEEERAPYVMEKSWTFEDFINEFNLVNFQLGGAYYSVTDGGEDAVYFINKEGKEIIVFNQNGLTKENLLTQKNSITIELMRSGHYFIYGHSTKASDDDFRNAYIDELGVMYSQDRKKLIGVYGSYLPDYEIAEGTEIICDDALNCLWGEIEGLMINGTITIPSSVQFIGRNPFRGDYDNIICKSPHFVVEDGALYTADKKRLISCFTKESTFVVPNGVEQISSFAFYCCNLTHIIIPESVWYIGDNPFISLNDFSNQPLVIESQSESYKVVNSALYNIRSKALISYFGKDTHFSVLEGTKIINDYAFAYATELDSLSLPITVERIGSNIFHWTELMAIYIPIEERCKFEQLLPNYNHILVDQKELKEKMHIKENSFRLSKKGEENTNSIHLLLSKTAIDFNSYMKTVDWNGHKDLEFIRKLFPLLSIKKGYMLDAFQCGDTYGFSYRPYVHRVDAFEPYDPSVLYKDSMLITNRLPSKVSECIPPILPYFKVPFTELGILQAWLLNNLSTYMPKGWHAYYGIINYIFRPEDIIYNLPNDIKIEEKIKIQTMSPDSYKPNVIIKGNEAVLSYIYWGNWEGLIQCRVKVRKAGISVLFGEIEKVVLAEYDCGIII